MTLSPLRMLATAPLLVALATACGSSRDTSADDGTGPTMLEGDASASEGAGEASEGASEGGTGARLDLASVDVAAPVCGGATLELAPVPPNVMLVLDNSGSMYFEEWDHDANAGTPEVTRWASLHAVVSQVVDTFAERLDMGAVLFPSVDRSGAAGGTLNEQLCYLEGAPEVPVGSDQGAAILSVMPAAESPGEVGQTPAKAAMNIAHEHLGTLDPDIPRVILLVMDGEPNCNGPEPEDAINASRDLRLRAAEIFAEGTTVFVVGLDIPPTSWDKFNALAVAGGAPAMGAQQFYNAVNEQALLDSLEEAGSEIRSCAADLSEIPENPDRVRVEVGGQILDLLGDCSEGDGWTWIGDDFDRIQVCGAACDDLNSGSEVLAKFECPPQG